ncbi:MAG TPA: hypothetical protein VG055_12945 [Planctomycetaceae bacterium]|jgi:hypothetical protein|nr:hypothetical protein [Planctomycetaceae bacterium]
MRFFAPCQQHNSREPMNDKPDRKRWGQSIELETLDQLLGGTLPLATIRSLYDSQDHFVRAITAMLHTGQVRLVANGKDVEKYRWRNMLGNSDSQSETENVWLEITDVGARRVC